jgi:hypothetical protein
MFKHKHKPCSVPCYCGSRLSDLRQLKNGVIKIKCRNCKHALYFGKNAYQLADWLVKENDNSGIFIASEKEI